MTLSTFQCWILIFGFFSISILVLTGKTVLSNLQDKQASEKQTELATALHSEKERTIAMEKVLGEQNELIEQMKQQLNQEKEANETLRKQNRLLNGTIHCKELEIQELEVRLSHRNSQIDRLKQNRNQLKLIKSHFLHYETLHLAEFKRLLTQSKNQTKMQS